MSLGQGGQVSPLRQEGFSGMPHEMMMTIDAGHVFVALEGRTYIVDTGSPMTFCDAGSIELDGRRFEVAKSGFGIDIATLSGHVGREINGLLGCDILNAFDVVFDAPAGRLTLVHAEADFRGETIGIEFIMGVPVVEVRIGDAPLRVFLDTGAPISYVLDLPLGGFAPDGSYQDFYPGFGEFTVDVFRVPVRTGGIVSQLRIGTLPVAIRDLLRLANVKGIVGSELIQDRRMCYAARRSKIAIA